ncbi:MAG: septum site-determining protein MinC [Rhodoferax sp.]|nr:septum site-determining protein MinC [Rhodoferax sp.]
MSTPVAGSPPVSLPASFEIKSAQLQLVALLVKTPEIDTLVAQLLAAYGPDGENPDFFDHDALVLDFSHIPTETPEPDWKPLLTALRTCRLVAVAVRGASQQWLESAKAVGLVEAPPDAPRVRGAVHATETVEVVKEVVHEVVREIPGPATMVVDKPLRSGQKIYARGADLVVLAMVNQGAEVAADGNIHVYAPLRGKAMAGARGNTQARIFSLCMEPELVSIAGVYRTSENPLPAGVHGKPAQVRLSNDGKEKLIIEALKS